MEIICCIGITIYDENDNTPYNVPENQQKKQQNGQEGGEEWK